MAQIIYTKTDETPAMATYSLLPILKYFVNGTGVEIQIRDISLSARILSVFSDILPDSQKQEDDLSELGKLVNQSESNIIKLPNISASTSQLKAAIQELQSQGYSLPDYPENPQTPQEISIKQRYDKVKGSAVNPVLRQGNSDRRVLKPVKDYAQKHPHKLGEWNKDSKTHVASMKEGDFKSNEKSITVNDGEIGQAKIEFTDNEGHTEILKASIPLSKGDIIDATFMSKKELIKFLEQEITDAQQKGLLFSVHLKATMMKISDPIIFGHVVSSYFKDLFQKHKSTFDRLSINPNNGLGELYSKIETLPDQNKKQIEEDIQNTYKKGPELAMVDSNKGITSLHVSSDIIVDASMPAMIKNSGKMWNPKGELQETKAVIPDSTYAQVYSEIIEFCKTYGSFDPKTMGSVSNVGLMAQKAEEYGSHDKTFECKSEGTVRVISESGQTLLEHQVEQGDIWRMCQAKEHPVKDWISLAISRSRITKSPAVFWLDESRAHDAQLIKKVKAYLSTQNIEDVEIHIMPPSEAVRYSCNRLKNGQDTISVTGNVLRDYLTDLFPILELGTSAKMLSVVPLLNGGRLFETGAGGSAPKLFKQFLEKGHLRWDSLGEYMSLSASLEHIALTQQKKEIKILSETLNQAISKLLNQGKSSSSEMDTRESHFYLTMYWAQSLAKQSEDAELREKYSSLAKEIEANEEKITSEIRNFKNNPISIGGYYKPSEELASKAMRPSTTFNQILDQHNK